MVNQMAMQNATRRELHKLRELIHFLLRGAGATPRGPKGQLCCTFCLQKFEYAKDFDEHGNSIGPKFVEKLSIHHMDGNHQNNLDSNKALSHTSCHKSHHRTEANLARSKAQ